MFSYWVLCELPLTLRWPLRGYLFMIQFPVIQAHCQSSCSDKDLWLLCLTFLITDAAMYLCCNHVFWLSYRVVLWSPGFNTDYDEFTYILLVWGYVFTSLEEGAHWTWCLNMERDRSGSVRRKLWVSGVHWVYLLVPVYAGSSCCVLCLGSN